MTIQASGSTIQPLNLGAVNVALVKGERSVLIDAGLAMNHPRLERFLGRQGITPGNLAAIVLTHMHSDHVGRARRLADHFGAQLLISEGAAPAAVAGKNAPGEPTRAWVAAMSRMGLMPNTFESFTADRLLAEGEALHAFGLAGKAIATPGHTDHCMSVVLDVGVALMGDLLMGSPFAANRPSKPLLLWSDEAWHASLQRMSQEAWTVAFVGHGRPIDRASFDRFVSGLNGNAI